MKLFELSIGTTRRYIAAADHEDAYRQGTDPAKHPDICFLPFEVSEVTVPGYDVILGCGAEAPQVPTAASVEQIARLCHEVNRAYCQSIGDDSQPSWDNAPEWQRDSAMNGVCFHLENDVTPEQSHENWMREKAEDGWVYGPVKDPEKKEHPCMVPYDQLPIEQRTKDYLFKAVVDTFKKSAIAGAAPADDAIPTEREALKAWLTERDIEFTPQWGNQRLLGLARSWLAAQGG